MIRRIPIRWRLTILYTTLSVLVLIVFSIAVYIGMQRRLSSQLDDDLRSQASLAARSITPGVLETEYEFTDEALLRAFDLEGQSYVYRTSSQTATAPIIQPDVVSAFNGHTTYRTLHFDDQHIRTVTVPLQVGDGDIVGALQLGYSTKRIDDPLDFLLHALFLIAPIAAFIAAAIGYMLAGRALRPVSRITTLASQITGADLTSRLNLDLPNDELGRLASTFDSMLDRITLAFQRQQQFTGDAAHELRTPLALMRSQIDLAVSQADSTSDYREAMTALDGDVGRMTTLVGTLLSLARADAGELRPNLEPVDLAALAGDVVEQLRPIAEENGLELGTDLRATVVAADADMLIQVLVNLVDNAIKNTPSGGRITVESGTFENRPFLAVRDTGTGIAPEHLGRIFDRFYRVDTGRARSRGGSGLGLAICQSIARAHGGTLTAISAPGAGSTFRLELPARPG